MDQDERRRLMEMRNGKQTEIDKARLRKVNGGERERERKRQNSQTEVDRNEKTIF